MNIPRPQVPRGPPPQPGAPAAVLYLSKACSSTKCIYKSLRMFFFILKLTIIFYCEKCGRHYIVLKMKRKKKRKAVVSRLLDSSAHLLLGPLRGGEQARSP